MFYREPDPCQEADIKFKILSAGVLAAFRNHGSVHHNNLTLGQWKGFKEVRELIKNGTIRLSVSDKGGEFVALPLALDKEIISLHLQDATVYGPATEKNFLHSANA